MASNAPPRRRLRGGPSGLRESPFGSDGHILSSDERQEVRRKAGLCLRCGLVQTYERPRKGLFTRLNLRPITKDGEIYRGVHLQCYGGMVGAKEKLGERVTDEDREFDRRAAELGPGAAAKLKKKGKKAARTIKRADAAVNAAANAAEAASEAAGGGVSATTATATGTTTSPPAVAASSSAELRDSGHRAELGQHAPGLHPGMLHPPHPGGPHHQHHHQQARHLSLPPGGQHGHPFPPPPSPQAHLYQQQQQQAQAQGAAHPPLLVVDTSLQRVDSLSTIGAPSEYLEQPLRQLGQAGGGGGGGGGQDRLARQVDAVNQYQERMALMRMPVGGEAGGSGLEVVEGGGGVGGGGGGSHHLRSGSLTDAGGAGQQQQQQQHHHRSGSLTDAGGGGAGGGPPPASPGRSSFGASAAALEQSPLSEASSPSPSGRKSAGRFGSLKNRLRGVRLPSIADSTSGAAAEAAAAATATTSNHSNGVESSASGSAHRREGSNLKLAPHPPTPPMTDGVADMPEMTAVPPAPPPADMTPSWSSRRGASALDDLDSDPEEGVRRVAEAARGRDYQAVLACVKTHRTSAGVARAACRTIRVGLVSIVQGEEGDDGGGGAESEDRVAVRAKKEASKAGAKGSGGGKGKGKDDLLMKKKKGLAKKEALSSSSSPSAAIMKLLPPTWVKVLAHAASVEHASDPSVQAEVVRTMWTLAALADRHKSDVKDYGGVEMTVSAMGRHPDDPDVQACGAGLLGCLAGSDRHGGGARGARGAATALVRAAGFQSSSGGGGEDAGGGNGDAAAVSECALRALFQLTTFAARQGGPEGGRAWAAEVASAGGDGGGENGGGNGLAFVARAMKAHGSSAGVQAWACRLLWALSSIPKEGTGTSAEDGGGGDVDDDGGEEEKREIEADDDKPGGGGGDGGFAEANDFAPAAEATQELVDGVGAAAERHAGDPFAAAAALGLLTNLSAAASVSASAGMARSAAEATVKIMKANPDSADLLRSGCVVISNLCSRRGRAKSDDDGARGSTADAANDNRSSFTQAGGVEVVVDILQRHVGDRCPELRAEACQALTALCVDAAWNKEKAANAGGVRAVIGTYRSQIGRDGPGAKRLRERACETLASLAVGRAHVSALNGSGIMVDLIKNALDEGLASSSTSSGRKGGGGKGGKGRVVIPLVMLNLLSANCSGGDAAAKAATASTVVKFVLQNCRDADEAESALSMLQALTTVQDCVDVVVRSNVALDGIVSAMESFGKSAALQESACGLLSNLYVRSGGRHRDESDLVGLGLEVELVARALRTHPYVEGVEERACLALRNFCAVAPLKALGHDAVLPVLRSAVEEAVRVLGRNAQNPAVQENAIGFIWAMARMSQEVCVAVASSPDGVKQISDALRQFPEIETLQREAIGAMEAISRIPSTHQAMGTTAGVDAVLRCMSKYDNQEEMVACGCSLLAALSGHTHQAKVNVIEHELTIPRTIGCMYQYPNSALVQGSACAILANIAIDNYIKEQIVNEGGINLIQNVLNSHKSDEWVVECACEALGSLISGAQSEILLGNKIVQKVISVIEEYPRSERVQERGMSAIWNLSVKGAEFKHEIARLGGIRAIVNTMEKYLSSEHVQEKGCVTLWSLAVSEANQAEVGRAGGVNAIVNGALAHIGNAQLQSEAIGALRTLATNLENKERIRDGDGVHAIVSAMWVHYTNASVQEAGFSALTNIAVNPRTNQVSRMSKNELEAITSAMRRFPLSESLQQQACILLRNYTFSPPNIVLMKGNSLLFDLLQQAAENHPTACSERVIYIVDQLF